MNVSCEVQESEAYVLPLSFACKFLTVLFVQHMTSVSTNRLCVTGVISASLSPTCVTITQIVMTGPMKTIVHSHQVTASKGF